MNETQLTALRNEFHEFNYDVRYGVHQSGDPVRDSIQCEVLIYALAEVDRQNGYKPHDPAKHLLNTILAYLMALRLDAVNSDDLASYIGAGKSVEQVPEFWQRSTRLLGDATNVLKTGLHELNRSDVPKPGLANLPALLQTAFFSLDADEADTTAADIVAELETAQTRLMMAHAKRIGAVASTEHEGR